MLMGTICMRSHLENNAVTQCSCFYLQNESLIPHENVIWESRKRFTCYKQFPKQDRPVLTHRISGQLWRVLHFQQGHLQADMSEKLLKSSANSWLLQCCTLQQHCVKPQTPETRALCSHVSFNLKVFTCKNSHNSDKINLLVICDTEPADRMIRLSCLGFQFS